MPKRVVRRVVIVGAGSAGFMSALTCRLTLPNLDVVVVHSPDIPIIGVGESTTLSMPRFLHDHLGLDRKQFFQAVEPSWKLGIKFEWGLPGDYHFHYTFDPVMDVLLHPNAKVNAFYMQEDMRDSSLFYALMDRDKSPCRLGPDGQPQVSSAAAYHLHNVRFVPYLEAKAKQFGVQVIAQDVVGISQDEQGFVTHLKLKDGRELAGDLFIDCTGFASQLLSKTMGVPFVSYADSLFVDTAVVGEWERSDEVIGPYTTATTMDCGWCWKIEFERHINRGYVHSSQFCSPEAAMREMRAKNPRIGELRTIKFKSGRYDKFWVKNVAAVGNSGGFVEPLEATALHMVIEHLRLLRQALLDADNEIAPPLVAVANTRFAELWDDIRDFLAVHYKFNRKLDTPFWRHAREHVSLAGAQPLIDLYQQCGPSAMCDHLIPTKTIFGFNGYLSLIMGQHVPTAWKSRMTSEEWTMYERYRDYCRRETQGAMNVKDSLRLVHGPHWNWSQTGR